MKITIPNNLTAAQIIKDCDNKTSKGTPVLYNTSWYKDEAFYITEITRGGVYEVDELAHKGKNWNEVTDLAVKENKQLLNFAELLYVMVEQEKQTGEHLLDGFNWSWTSSRDSDGELVIVGSFDSGGAYVGRDRPGLVDGRLGVCFARMILWKLDPVNEASSHSLETLEERVEKLGQALEELRKALKDINLT